MREIINLSNNNDWFDDFDEESKNMMENIQFLNLSSDFQNRISNNFRGTPEQINKSRTPNLNNPFGKDSIFYKAKEGSLRLFLEDRSLYQQAKNKFNDIDLENILINVADSDEIDDLPYFCKKRNRIRVVQHTIGDSFEKYFENFIDIKTKKLETYFDNFIWFEEGNNSNVICFHFFVSNNHIKEIICTMGSDIFDCLKSKSNINASGGFTVKNDEDEYVVNPALDKFKNDIVDRLKKFYYNEEVFLNVKLPIRTEKVIEALDQEFKAEGDYQRTVDWIFEKMEITTTLKDFVNDLKDDSKNIESYRFEESRYLPFHPNFDPVFNDSLLKAFGINPMVKIEDYFFEFEKEDIEKFKLVEKEVNWVYGFNAFFCGLWNGIIDTVDGFILLIPELYEIFTDRARLKVFLNLIKELFEHITELMGKTEEWELKNSSYSVYRYEYFQTYGLTIIMSLFLPVPKLAQSGKTSEAFKLFTQAGRTFVESEIVLTAYRFGLRVEKTSNEWRLYFYDILLSSGSKEKIANRIGNIMEVAAKNPNIVFKLLSEWKLEKLVNVKKGKGIKGFPKESFVAVQKKLYNANIAQAEFKVYYNGKTIVKELKAYSGSNIGELDGFGFSKSPNLRSNELKSNFSEVINGNITGRFLDTESKIFREFEDAHLKGIMKELGAKSTDQLRIKVSLQTILDPCNVCQGQMSKFQKLYNAKIKIFSSGAKDGYIFKKMYPKLHVDKPLKK